MDHTSEDNASFKKLMEKDLDRWREKFWWVFKGEDEQKKLKAIRDDTEATNRRKNNALKHEPLLRICDVHSQSNLMFMPNTYVRKKL